ncbi:MAG: hypothetical protein C7B45_14270 [Sulfobacillus acidophilus]|uniref:Uncharacterized protein n=1 Tax=Sulfobacillus acidophilus TaxID=53633 RepID=A0A2T2WED2_9FIRM|nr:MAG: hypothetical protein C7B45_14270 [Sulfobacillus acidophilus]
MADMHSDLRTTLKAVGYITSEQLQQHFGLATTAIALEPWMLMTAQGLWDRDQYQKGARLHHWALRTQVFLDLAPQLQEWQIEAHVADVIRPDALLQVTRVPAPIALEVDTGKENERQWQEKLVAYEFSPSQWHVFVVAQGQARRLAGLAQWLAENCPRPWLLLRASELACAWSWDWREPRAEVQNPPTTRVSLARTVQYCLNGEIVARGWAESELSAGHLEVKAYERRHGVDLYHLR